MKKIVKRIHDLSGFESFIHQIQNPGEIRSLGLNRAARLPVLSAISEKLNRPILLLTTKTDHALNLADELALWLPDDIRLFFPEPTALFYENAAWGDNTRRERILCLTTLASSLIPGANKSDSPPIIISPARSVMARIMPRQKFLKTTRTLKVGQNANPVELSRNWVAAGYEPTSTVVIPGQFARRGGILDIWPPADDFPSRLDFFGDQLDAIKNFDPATQRTTTSQVKILVPPAREFLIDPEFPTTDKEQEWTEFHIPLLHKLPASILDYLPRDTLIFIDDLQAFRETLNEHEEQAVKLRKDYLADEAIKPDHPLPYLTQAEIEDSISRFEIIELGPAGYPESNDLAHSFSPNQRFGGRLDTFIEHLKKMNNRGDEIVIVSRQAARLKELWEQNLREIDEDPPSFIQGSLSEGWTMTAINKPSLHLLTDGEIFGWKRPQPRQRPRVVAEAPEAKYIEFQINDLVVHVDHGIGRFNGLVQREIEGTEQEYICVEYSGGDQLYIPVHQADRLSKYIGARGHRPNITRLSGTDWQGVKSRVRRAVQAIAEDLLELYASRQIAKGYSFNKDNTWQKELEASFPYIETDDQLKVISEVKKDMENDRPMDRLICGDVGYGKTEVALRAAFKAVTNGKQVAMLVPTTILAQQHFRTFKQRLAAFPVKVEMLSRFRTAKEQRKILLDLAKGGVDIIIGTHRLVQEDVQFKDLGLVIIDEEQRFGVTHKEHLKKLRTEVDVLTMTATPIPRTLYMALTGVRDISTINTPPEERLPIVTHIGPYDPKITRQAITREIERGGQIFFVHNRVHSIHGIHNQISKLVPEARLAVAHGQMKEKELATRMRDFSNGEIDVLISTSIIESGLDIPNANTLIVDRADTFGLAQLYQLRGRVGRGAQRAYAYFFKHPSKAASEDGRLRLETLAENTQLGAGFSIAMRDLEIRGAGDFLGTRQHGFIAAVGLNLYTRLLSQAVSEIKDSGKISADLINTSLIAYHPFINIDLPFATNIPTKYVPEKEMRLRLYRRLADIHKLEEIDSIREEFADRFGKIPEELENLLYQIKVKILAEQIGVSGINGENKQIVLRFPFLPKGTVYNYPQLDKNIITGKNTIRFSIDNDGSWSLKLVDLLEKLLEYYSSNPKIRN